MEAYEHDSTEPQASESGVDVGAAGGEGKEVKSQQDSERGYGMFTDAVIELITKARA